MEIKISNGVATLKTFVTRKLSKQIRAALYSGVNGTIEGSDDKAKQSMTNLDIANFDKANDVALIGMVEKLVIDGNEMPITLETFDEMRDEDVQLLIDEVNKITKKK